MNRQVFNKGIALLLTLFPEKKISLEILWPYLNILTDEQFEGAVNYIISNEVEVRKSTNLIALILNTVREMHVDTGGEAWAEVLEQISSVGSWGTPSFSDSEISRSVTAIGWKNICLSTNISMERAHFFKIYDAFLRRKSNPP